MARTATTTTKVTVKKSRGHKRSNSAASAHRVTVRSGSLSKRQSRRRQRRVKQRALSNISRNVAGGKFAKEIMAKDKMEVSQVARAIAQLVNPDRKHLIQVNPTDTRTTSMDSQLACVPIRLSIADTTTVTNVTQQLPVMDDGGTLANVWDIPGSWYEFVLTDDPIVPLIMPVANPLGGIFRLAQWKADRQDPSGNISLLAAAGALAQPVEVKVQLGGSYFTPAGNYNFKHPIGCDTNGNYYFWVDAAPTYTASIHIVGTVSTVNATLTPGRVDVYILNQAETPAKTKYLSQPFSPTKNAQFDVPLVIETSGYMVFEVVFNIQPANPPEQIYLIPGTCTYSPSTSIISRHVLSDGFQTYDAGGVVSEVRVNGASLLITNTTPMMYAAGPCYGYCATEDFESWYGLTGNANAMTTLDTSVVYTDQLKRGMYGFVKPRHLSQIVSIAQSCGPQALPSINGDFADPWGFSVFFIKPGSPSGSPAPSFALTVTQAVEFFSVSPFLALTPPVMTAEAYGLYFSAVKGVGLPFSANESHLKMLWEKTKQAAVYTATTLLPGAFRLAGFAAALASNVSTAGAIYFAAQVGNAWVNG